MPGIPIAYAAEASQGSALYVMVRFISTTVLDTLLTEYSRECHPASAPKVS